MRAWEWEKLRDSYSTNRYKAVIAGRFEEDRHYEGLLNWANEELKAAREREFRVLSARVAEIEAAALMESAALGTLETVEPDELEPRNSAERAAWADFYLGGRS